MMVDCWEFILIDFNDHFTNQPVDGRNINGFQLELNWKLYK